MVATGLAELATLLTRAPGDELPRALRMRFSRMPAEAWSRALLRPRPHKVLPLLEHAFAHSPGGFADLAPTSFRAELAAAFATRPTGDIDLVAAPGEAGALCRVAESVGFQPSPAHDVSAESVTYINGQGLLADVHYRLPELPAESWEKLVVATSFENLRGVTALSLSPAALLAYFARHVHSHLDHVGPVLLWVLDFLYVLRKHGAAIAPAEVRRLCAREAAHVVSDLVGWPVDTLAAWTARRVVMLRPGCA